MSGHVLSRFRRPVRTTAAVVAAVAVTLSLSLTGQAFARDHLGNPGHHQPQAVPAPPAQPTSDNQIQNIDQVKTAIKAYYGDAPDANTVDPVTGAKDLHTFAANGAYAKQVRGIANRAEAYLLRVKGNNKPHHGKRAILLDVDDTSLNTYNYEIFSNFVYNPTSNAAFVNAGVFPAVPGMPGLVKLAAQKGYEVFYLTGRPGTQRAGTIANLGTAGYPALADDHLYLKDYTADTWLSSCAPSCTTIQYKSLTRQHIEDSGFDIVANFGDQFSDLEGGFADRTFKIPNPMYYLP